jgi:alkylation response protein AidB-like acyl-CoA dehydrogenase
MQVASGGGCEAHLDLRAHIATVSRQECHPWGEGGEIRGVPVIRSMLFSGAAAVHAARLRCYRAVCSAQGTLALFCDCSWCELLNMSDDNRHPMGYS